MQTYSNVNAPTIDRAGRVQQRRRAADLGRPIRRQLTFASDVDYVRGIHSWRGGFQIDGQWFNSTNSSNSLGTYTFSSLDAYEAGRPVLYTRRSAIREV